MAEELENNDERTEEATPERREEFREKGQVVVSRELTSVALLATSVAFFTFYAPTFMNDMKNLLRRSFESIATTRIDHVNFMSFASETGVATVRVIAPIFLLTSAVAIAVTLLQSRFNFSWDRVSPKYERIDPMAGLKRMISMQAVVELCKGVLKVIAVSIVGYFILRSEIFGASGLMLVSFSDAWAYWGQITSDLFWGTAILLLLIAAGDYLYHFITLERQLRMTKREVKEDVKRREVDPHVRSKMRRMQRDVSSRRMVERTREATVLITNPTHYSIAIKFELGMPAPILVAKGIDHLALAMREEAKLYDIPRVENRPLAQALYKTVEVDQQIPESMYKAVSEVIRYVFRIKGIRLSKDKKTNKEVASNAFN